MTFYKVLPDDLLHEAIPGNIRKAEHFVAFLKRLVEYLKVHLSTAIQMITLNLFCRRGCVSYTLLQKRRFPSFSILKISPTSREGRYGKILLVGSKIGFILSSTKMIRFCAERLQSLVRTLELNRLDEYASLQKVASFATLVATYEKGTFASLVYFNIILNQIL